VPRNSWWLAEMQVRLNSSAIAEIFILRLCAFKSACPNQDVDQGAGVNMAGRFMA
jgi:hypothetical protein